MDMSTIRGRRSQRCQPQLLKITVATQDTVTHLVPAIRRVAREVPGAAEQIAAVCAGHDYSGPGKPKTGWDDPAAKDALVSALVNDANAVVAALQGRDLDERADSALALLALVAGQDVEPAEGPDGRWRIAHKVAGDRVISAVDPGCPTHLQFPGAAASTWPPTRTPGSSPMRSGPWPLARRTPTRRWRKSSWPPKPPTATATAAARTHREPPAATAAVTRRPACLVRRLRLRHRGPARRDREGRP